MNLFFIHCSQPPLPHTHSCMWSPLTLQTRCHEGMLHFTHTIIHSFCMTACMTSRCAVKLASHAFASDTNASSKQFLQHCTCKLTCLSPLLSPLPVLVLPSIACCAQRHHDVVYNRASWLFNLFFMAFRQRLSNALVCSFGQSAQRWLTPRRHTQLIALQAFRRSRHGAEVARPVTLQINSDSLNTVRRTISSSQSCFVLRQTTSKSVGVRRS